MILTTFPMRVASLLLFTRIAVATPLEKDCDVIQKDVVILGGGSSGTYAAVRLREDYKKSVIIVEANNRLGGHANTYIDPATSKPVDFGVVVFYNETLVTDYFNRLGDPLVPASFSSAPTIFADFSTNKYLPTYSPPDPSAALQKYAQLLATTFPYVEAGFDFPNPIPEDLYLPFGEFAAKYGIEDLISTAFQFGEGVSGDFLAIPAIYILKNFSLSVVNGFFTGFLTSSKGSQGLYDNAAKLLGKDVLFSTTATTVKRFADHVEVLTTTPGKRPTLIKAKKILVTIPPTISNLKPFDLTSEEKSIYSTFQSVCYGTSLFKLSKSAEYLTSSVRNVGESTPFNLPVLPGIYNFYPTVVPGLINAKYFDNVTPTVAAAEATIRNKLRGLAPVLAAAANSTTVPVFDPVFVRTEQHCPFELTVTSDQIKSGFYKKLLSLQGAKRTWLAGAAVQAQDSTQIWRQLEASTLPGLLKGL